MPLHGKGTPAEIKVTMGDEPVGVKESNTLA